MTNVIEKSPVVLSQTGAQIFKSLVKGVGICSENSVPRD